ncbi:MAG: hypothetical protein RPR40_00380, partial [Bermanella sp.]
KDKQVRAQILAKVKAKANPQALLSRWSKPQPSMLIVQANGFGLEGIVVQLLDGRLCIQGRASTSSTDPVTAVADILGQLATDEEPIKHALLLSVNVIPALIELPIEGDSDLGEAKILELVRWEMEAFMSEQVSQWNIGWLLIGRGYISEIQRDDILQGMKAEAGDGGQRGGRAPARFGEEAIKLGLVNREQLEECLAIQENLYLMDDAIDCSWQPEPTSAGQQQGLWLCGAMSATTRQKWIMAFQAHNVRLEWVYPMAGIGAASLAANSLKEPLQGPQVVLEIQPGYVTCSRIESRQVTQFAMLKCCDHSVSAEGIAELCQPLLSADIKQIYLAGVHGRIGTLQGQLQGMLQRPFTCLNELQQAQIDNPNKVDTLPFGAAIAAAQIFFEQAPNRLSIQLQGQPPPPPVYKRPAVQAYAACGLLCFAIAGSEGYFALTKYDIRQTTAANELEAATIEVANEKLTEKNEEYGSIKDKLDQLLEKEASMQARRNVITTVLEKRQQFAAAVLPMFATTVNDEMLIESIKETGWYQLSVAGWAMNQGAIDDFNAKLSRTLDIWDLTITSSPSSSQTGFNGLEGYQFTFSIAPQEAANE